MCLTNDINLKYLFKVDLALNNLQLLIYHKTEPNQKAGETRTRLEATFSKEHLHMITSDMADN